MREACRDFHSSFWVGSLLKKEPFNKELVSVCYVLGTLFSARVIGEQNKHPGRHGAYSAVLQLDGHRLS